MKYTFDVSMYATVYVEADNEKQARERLNYFAGWDDLGRYNEHVEVGPVSADLECEQELVAINDDYDHVEEN